MSYPLGMQRWIWVIVAVSVSTAVYFTIRYGLRPKAIPVMGATQFQELEQIGIVIYKRLRIEIRGERLIVLGSNAPEDAGVWQGLVRAAQSDGERTIVFADAENDREGLEGKVRAGMKSGQLVVVQGKTTDASHLVEGNLPKRLEKVAGHPVFAISTVPLVVTVDEYEGLQSKCLEATEQSSPHRKLECAAQKIARKYLKKKLAPEKIWAAMEQHGMKEYLLFIHRP